MKNTEFIFTFDKREQEIFTISMIPLKSKERMIGFCLGIANGLLDDPDDKLIKVSMCVTGLKSVSSLPSWYLNCDGKLWADDLISL